MEVFLLGVLASIVAAAALALARSLYHLIIERKKILSGWWWQITYPPKRETVQSELPSDSALLTRSPGNLIETVQGEISAWELDDSTDTPWSIELIKIRHDGKGRFHGKMWRVYRSNFHRKWKFEGIVHVDSTADCLYAAIDQHQTGGHGTMQLWRVEGVIRYCGDFAASRTTTQGHVVTYESTGAPVEWIKCRTELESKVTRWITPHVAGELLGSGWRSWSPGVRRNMARLLDINVVRWPVGFGYIPAVFGDLATVYALELERRRSTNVTDNASDDDVDRRPS